MSRAASRNPRTLAIGLEVSSPANRNSRSEVTEMYVITNITKATLIIDGVEIPPNMPLDWVLPLSEAVVTARDAGALRGESADENLAERKAEAEAFKTLHTCQPATDGEASVMP